MRYLLDTDTCSYIMRQKPPAVWQRLNQIGVGNVAVSVMTVAELRFGVEKLRSTHFTQRAVDDFIRYCSVLSWEESITPVYAQLRHFLDQQGTPIGNMDLLIAAHALQQNCILVTNNTRHFARVPNLTIENWTTIN